MKKLHGAGEAAWVKNGQIIQTSGLGFHPELFRPFTENLIRDCFVPYQPPLNLPASINLDTMHR